ncbi:MAG TPA: flavodoxin domain-containing protein [Candidatus Omnitrophota bacterium]|nr:flavodoxin domain-containing protein [Candidatus Omnitrophota bacterium]HPS36857.1 flavodoxin domain-containing protein [Candidatus Omnitrophota bacterium]
MVIHNLVPGIYSVGAIDWDARHFHGHTYSIKRGTTYNAYLIVDEKITLIDTVYGPFAGEMIEKIREILPPEKIDTIIVNHAETDHSGALPALMKFCPKAKLYGTARCRAAIEGYYHQKWDFQEVKTGDKLNLGKRNLMFVEAAMIHWPDSMFTCLIEDQILFSNDGFGQHYASSERFDDEVPNAVLMEEAERYYANILWPFSGLIAKKLEEIEQFKVPVKMIATAHGISWRKDPGQILAAYKRWAQNTTKQKIVVVYETMWGSTAKMAHKIAEGITEEGVSVEMFDAAQSDRSDIIYQMFEAKGYVIGSSNHDSGILPSIGSVLEFLKGLKPKNRIGCAFGSYGWSGVVGQKLETLLKEIGIELTQPSVTVQYAPDEAALRRCYELGREFARRVKASS